MHRFDIAHTHRSDDRLDVLFVPFPVVSFGIGSQIGNQIGNPEFKPRVHRHFGRMVVNIVLIFILRIGKPVTRLRERVKMLFLAGTALCSVLAVFSLTDAFTNFFAF